MTECSHTIKWVFIKKYFRLYDRFQEKTNKDGPIQEHVPELGNCWIWMGWKSALGYGKININNKIIYCHRLTYLFNIGEIPEGMCVCHKCDNPGCVNPSHLFLGTNNDNVKDKMSKNRHSFRGENHPRSYLKEKDIFYIRELKTIGLSRSEISALTGVKVSYVDKITTNQVWKHLLTK